MSKENVAHINNAIYLILKKRNPVICDNMGELRTLLNNADTERQILHDLKYM
jgi:hypothetical protein